MKIRFLSFVVVAAMFAGCSPGPKPASSSRNGSSEGREPVATNVPPANVPPTAVAPGERTETKGSAPFDPKALPQPPPLNPKAFEIEKTGKQTPTGAWVKSKLKPAELAVKVGDRIRQLKGAYGEAITTIKTPAGNGQVKNQIKIQDPKVFSVQYLKVEEIPSAGEMRSNGKVKARTNAEGALSKPTSIATKWPETKLSGADLAIRWPREFPTLMFRGITDGQDAWKPFMEALAAGKGGFTSEVSERTVNFRGEKLTTYRVVARRTPQAAKAAGPCEIEMVINGKFWMPVTVRVNMAEPQKKEWKILWSAGWNFNRKFDQKEFALGS